jgi:hypothetical protein
LLGFFIKFAYFCGYFVGFVVGVILEAFLTGGVAAVKELVQFFKAGVSRASRGIRSLGKRSLDSMKAFSTFFDDLFRQVTKDPKALFERFKQWLDELIQAIKKELGLVDEVMQISDEALEFLKKMADDALKLKSKERSKVCGVLEGIETIFNYSYKKKLPAGVFPEDLHPLVDRWVKEMWELSKKGKIKKLPMHHGKCAEVMNISQYLKKIDPKGKMTIEEARKTFEGFISHAIQIGDEIRKGEKIMGHGNYKKACNSCKPLLKHFNIKEFKIK